jgi:hypothetical protein
MRALICKWSLFLFLLIITFSPRISYAQKINHFEDENFDSEVKQIEDFIDRFNFSPDSYFIKNYEKKFPEKKYSREAMIKMLFNNQSFKPGASDTIKKFISTVLNPKKEYYLNFYQKYWYAELDCKFERKGTPVKIKLILELEVADTVTYACSWVICGIKSDLISIPDIRDSSKFINPSSNGTDFIGLDRILNDKKNIISYFNSNFKPSNLTLFVNELRKGNLNFIQVNSVTYHFLQVKGWEFEVSYFLNNTKSSGWLISKLNKLPSNESKDYYIYKNLGVQ